MEDKFWDFLDSHKTRRKFKPEIRHDSLYPSEASVQFYDGHGDLTTEGQCMRAAFFRVEGGLEPIPHSAYTQWIFEMGNRVEQMIVDECKMAGVWVDNSIKFYNKEYNISGEIDVLLIEPDGSDIIYPAEIKSCYGYFAKKEIMGNTKQVGQPKMSQLLQLLVYLNEFKDQFPYGKMIYFFRDTTERKTFKIELHQEGDITYPKIDGRVVKSYSINDILARYKKLQKYIDTKTVPPMDYELQYPDEKIHDFAKKGKIGKTKYQLFCKGKLKDYEHLGDWRCGYCSYKHECFPDAIDPPKKTHL